ncbi:MAG: cation:proton antiporter, partial [Candidatus Limnocylindrales bacterium]
PLREGLLVGAMVAATDPVSIVATFRRLRAPRSLAVLVEAESLFNDGTSIVLFSLALAALSSPVDLPGAAVAFIGTIAISVLLGAVAGFVVSRAIAHVDDRAIEATVSIVLAYGIYLLADALGESGVIATVMAGLTLGTYGRSIGMTERTVEALDVVWDLLAFILTAVAFLVVGMGITLDELGKAAIPAAWAILSVMVARAVIVYGLVGGWRLLSHSGQRPLAPRWLHVLFWAGLRGAVTVALALSLPDDLPDRRLLQGITFTVVLFTLLVQGSTAGQLMELIGLGKEPAAASATAGRAGPA